MSDVATRFHQTWQGMVQPIEGLVVSVPVLEAAECMERQPPDTQARLHELCPGEGDGPRRIADLPEFLAAMLDLRPESFDDDGILPEDLQLYVPEGGQTIRPTVALRKPADELRNDKREAAPSTDDSTPASRAGEAYGMLVWDIPEGLAFDKPETDTGPWDYPPAAKFDRLLRECRVPIGLLTNRRSLRLFYAPHGESTGAITFHIHDMAEVGGRPILDAFIMLLSDFRWFGAEPERRLPAILRDSRARQADVTNELADQLFEALTILLQGFEAAAERDGDEHLREALAQEDDHLYGGLLTVLLRLVFLLYAEDRGLMPTEDPVYGEHLSVLALFGELQADQGAYPDTMNRRFGAYPRLVAVFRAVFYGLRHGNLYIPPRHGVLFDPEEYSFLEGWSGGAPPVDPRERSQVRVPSISDETIHLVLEKLLVLDGQRLSYRALEVEQIGSVYEALMGYHVQRVSAPSVCMKPSKVWMSAPEILAVPKGQRVSWLQERGLAKSQAEKLVIALGNSKDDADVFEVLRNGGVKNVPVAAAGRLVIQPGEERRRTSSHYTPRSLSEPIVKRTLEPLITAMGGEPPSEKLLRLKVCDPAMGSGAFLVAACRFLADQVVAAWTREGVIKDIVEAREDPVVHARRLVAQRCLYGVDKNPFAVNLAKLSLWLETLAKHEPFTFVDHALKCGDSLVGLDLAQIKRFDWDKDVKDETGEQAKKAKSKKDNPAQLNLFEGVIERAVLHAYKARRKLLEIAEQRGDHAELAAHKKHLHEEAERALDRARLVADMAIGAFFAESKDNDRRKALVRRRDAVEAWLLAGPQARAPMEVQQWAAQIREQVRPFHWPLEFPEVFWDERPDPLEEDRVNARAWMDAVVGNPPFMGGKTISTKLGDDVAHWCSWLFGGKNADYSALFFRRAAAIIGLHGTIGFIATNTIAQGDTRGTGLQHLLKHDHLIYDATASQKWPGEANVSVAMVHLAKGTPAHAARRPRLDGASVPTINSRLRPKPERPDPVALHDNADRSFNGVFLMSMGFTVTPEQRSDLVAKDPRNAERIFPYLGGEEVNTSPTQSFHRYVISFGNMTLDQAERWPDLIAIVREKVRPERQHQKNQDAKKFWWQHFRQRPALYAAIAKLDRCLVTCIHSKHLVLSWQPVDRIFSHGLNVFALASSSHFSVLQSRPHEGWGRLLGSSLEDRLRYAASDCFETFPFPRNLDLLEPIGERLCTARTAYMIDTDQGLTKTYNALKDPECTDRRVQELRHLHVEMDRAVLDAYGWSDIEVPPYTDPVTESEKDARQAFEDEVIDRLFALNAERATEENRLGSKKASRRGGSG